jgi:putative heme transporter
MAGPVSEPPNARSGGADDAGGRRPGGRRDWRWLLRKAVVPAVSLAVVVGIFAAVIPRFASYGVVWHSMSGLDGRDWAVIGGCTVLNVATSGPPWMAAVPGLTYKRSMLLTQTSTLMTTALPMGEAVGFATQIAMLRSWRFTPQVVSAGFVLVAGWNQLINVIVPVASIAVLGASHTNPLYRTVSLISGVLLVAVAVAVALLFRSPAQARRIGDFAGRVVSHAGALVHRPPRTGWGDRLVAMRSQTLAVVSRRWPFLTIATVAN